MKTRCNMCMEVWDYNDYVHVCPECLVDDYLTDGNFLEGVLAEGYISE